LLADHGVAAFVLKYRVSETQAETGDRSNPARQLAIDDGKAAVKLVRSRAREWGVDPRRIGFLGFSAGAIVALQTALADDRSARPDFVAPIYGPMDRVDVPPDAPPLFAAIAADDQRFGGHGFGLVEAWIAAKRPAELHVFAKGGHGFGMNSLGTSSDHWIDEFYWWMQASGFLSGAHRH
jgi:acetyl esterase/lipase